MRRARWLSRCIAMTYAKLTTRPAKTPYGAITIASIFIIIMAG
jgi:hypothetical protein